MKTTDPSGTSLHADAVSRRDLAMFVFLLSGTFALDAAVLLAAARLTGTAWSELGLLALPPAMAGAGAVLTFFALNRMVLRSELTATPHARVDAARAC